MAISQLPGWQSAATSCNIIIQDTTFDSNGAQEALGMGLMCNSSSPIQACVFELTRTNFTNNLLLGPGLNHTVNTNSVNANYGFVNTTAAALVVKADGNSAYSLTVTACSFAHNQGGGLLVQQLWPDFSPLPVSGHVFVINSSFTEHSLLPGGLPALAVFGALDVTLSGSVLRNNSMGAAALELIQDAVIIDTLVMADNIAINATASSMDIFMVDNGSPSSVDISGSLFANNTGFSYNTSLPAYSAEGAVTVITYNPTGQGGAVKARFSGAGQIIDSVFLGNTALSGGAVSLSNMNMGYGEEFEMSNSTFVANSAVMVPQRNCPTNSCVPNEIVLVPGSGGAIQISGTALLLSRGCSFISNTAQGRGGALFAELPFDTSIIRITSQQGARIGSAVAALTTAPEGLPLTYSIIFLNNTAQVSGGAIAARNYPLSISAAAVVTSTMNSTRDTALTYSLFQGNSAPTGGAVSVFQVSLSHILFHTNIAVESSTEQRVTDEGGAGHGGAVSIVGSSGDDYYGQLVVGSSNATAAPAVVRLDSSNATGVVLGGLLEADGVAAFTGVRLRGVAGSTFNLSFSAVTQYRSLVSLELSFVTVRPCQLNEYLDPGTRDLCVNCSAGTYNLIPTNTICAACPAGATCSSACLGNATCQLSGLEYAGFIVPSGGMWHSSMFSDQVMACPNPASCTFAARQQRLQQLQVSVRNAYRQQQYLNAVGQAPQAPPSHPPQAGVVGAASLRPAARTAARHAAHPSHHHHPSLAARAAHPSAPPPSPLPPSPGPATPTGPPPPPQQTPALVATPSQSADALFLDVLFTSIALEVSEYSSAQCAAGYTGRLCASCASGYGSIDIATCVVCPSRAVNTLYYVLATLLTLVLLAFAMHASIQEAVKLQTEHFEEQERRLEEEERERARREQEDEGECEDEQQRLSSGQVSSAVIGNTMTRSLKGSSKLKLYTTSKKALTNFTSPTFSSASNPTYSAGPPTPFLNTTPALTAPPTAADAYRTQGIDAALVDIQLTSGAEQPDGGSAADGSFPAPSLRRHSAAPGPFPSARSMFSSLAQQRSIPEAEALLACESVAVAEMSQRASAPADQRQSTSPPGATPRPILAAERTARPATREDVTPNAMAQKGAPATQRLTKPGDSHAHGIANKMSRGEQASSEWSDALQADEGVQHVRSHFYDARDPILEDAQSALSVIIRIFVSYIQVLGLLQNVPRIYPAGVRKFLQVVSQSTSAGAAVSLDCSLPDGGPASKATTRTLILALAPCYVALACWAGWTLRALFLYTRARLGWEGARGIDPAAPVLRGISKYVGRLVTMTSVVVIFFFYPSAVQSLLAIFDCDTVDSGTPRNPLMARSENSIGSYWRQDYSQQCYQGPHLGLAMGLGVPGLALLAVGWPLFSAAWLYINMRKLYTDPDFTGMYAFVFEGYQPRYGWWESVVLLRKLSIAFLVVFLHALSRQGLQVLIVSMVLGIALYLQVAHMPYENGYMNWLEFLSLSTCVTTIYFSLFFSDSLRDAPLAIVTVLVILVNAVTMCVFVWAMMRAGWHSMLQMLKLSAEDFPLMSKSHIRAHIHSSKVDMNPVARKVFALAATVALDFNLLVLKVGRWIRAQRGQ
ncbi:MAG: hypothetical protein WDW36_009444 [Sanguina aurantia]